MIPIDIDANRELLSTATHALLTDAVQLSPDRVRAPSLLPAWTVGHVLTHLARNADGTRRMLDGTRRGVILDMYPGGAEARAADIETGAAREPDAIVEDLQVACWWLSDAIARMEPDHWAGACRPLAGERPVWQMLQGRRREVEIHHVDCNIGYGPSDWPEDFVASELDRLAAALPDRLPPRTALVLEAPDGGRWRVGPVKNAASRWRVVGSEPWLLAWLVGRDVPGAPGPIFRLYGRPVEAGPELAPW